MNKRVWLYVLTALLLAACVAGAAVAFVYAQYIAGAVVSLCAVIAALALAGEIAQDNFYDKCEKLFQERRFEEEKQVLDSVERRNLIFPFVRIGFYLLAIQNAVARDDLELAKSYISRLRQPNEVWLKYRTSYVLILIRLDEGNLNGARSEYEDFRVHNENVELYASQLEVLEAIFTRLFTRRDEPLPLAAVNSYFPVVKRILGRHFEENAPQADWGE